nr:ATP-binding protein [Microcystis aeruginosa BS13-02]
MTRWFNIAGPCKDDIHYMLSPTVRLPDLEELIQQHSYFVLHAPRQTGKTTAMLSLAKQLTDTGNYAAVMVSVEVGSAFNHDPSAAELAILGAWYNTINIRLPDSLQDQTLISVLRQLRDGFPNRPENFPSSVGLIGLRDVRDYKVASGGSDRLNTSSPFNIKVASLTMRNFNLAEVGELYQQHTAATGQIFTPE